MFDFDKLKRRLQPAYEAPTKAIRATVLQIDPDGTAIAKVLEFEPKSNSRRVIIPRRTVRSMDLRRGELLDLDIDAGGGIIRVSRVFG